jgi:hypothetical protein
VRVFDKVGLRPSPEALKNSAPKVAEFSGMLPATMLGRKSLWGTPELIRERLVALCWTTGSANVATSTLALGVLSELIVVLPCCRACGASINDPLALCHRVTEGYLIAGTTAEAEAESSLLAISGVR